MLKKPLGGVIKTPFVQEGLRRADKILAPGGCCCSILIEISQKF